MVSALLASPIAGAGACGPDRIDFRSSVAFVFDGDTVRLDDGRTVRLIGVDTPERAHGDKQAEPWSGAATRALRDLLLRNGQQVAGRYDRDKKDRYGRTLAHLFLPDGTSLSTALLERGLATPLVIPPNTWNAGCYGAAASRAQAHHTGIWSLPALQPVEAGSLPANTRGYRLVHGTVTRVSHGGHNTWIGLDDRLTLRIQDSDLIHFPRMDPDTLLDHSIRARGIVYRRKGQLRMQIRHPGALDIGQE